MSVELAGDYLGVYSLVIYSGDFPGGPVVRTSPSSAWEVGGRCAGLILGGGSKSHMPHG